MPIDIAQLERDAQQFHQRTRGKLPRVRLTNSRHFFRIIKAKYTDQLGMGFGDTRFSDPRYVEGQSTTGLFRIFYAAATADTAFAERIVRDRCNGLASPFAMSRKELSGYVMCELEMIRPMNLVDLRPPKNDLVGIATDTIRASDHLAGRKLAYALFTHPDQVDGILYPSRFTGDANIALFERCVAFQFRPVGKRPARLLKTNIKPILDAWEIAVVRNEADADQKGRTFLPDPEVQPLAPATSSPVSP